MQRSDSDPLSTPTSVTDGCTGAGAQHSTEESLLLSHRKHSFVRFKDINANAEADLEHAVTDFYSAIDEDNFDDEELDEDALWLREQRHVNKSLHWLKRPSLFMIGIIAFLLSFSSITGESARQIIIFKLSCNSVMLGNGLSTCDPVDTEVLVSRFKAVTLTCISITCAITVTKVGELSDQYGRRLFIILIIVTTFFSRVLKFYFLYNYNYLKFGWLVFVEALGSITGGLIGFITLMHCYVSDIAEVHERSYYIGVAMAFFFTGISLGPIASNIVMSISRNWRIRSNMSIESADSTALGSIAPFEWDPLKFELVCFALLFVFSITLFPESRSERARSKSRSMSISRASSERDLLALRSQVDSNWEAFSTKFKNLFKFLVGLKILWISQDFKPVSYSDKRFSRERIAVLILVICDCLSTAFATCMGEIIVLYGLLRLNWNASSLSYVLAISCGSRAIVLVVLAPLLNKYLYHKLLKFRVMKYHFDMLDFSNIVGPLSVEAISMIILPFLKTSGGVFALLALASLSTLASPSLNSSIIKYFPDAKTGEVFSAISLVKSILNLGFPVLMLMLYNVSISKWNYPGFVFHLAAVLMFVCVIGIFIVKYLLSLSGSSEPEVFTRSNSISRKSSVVSFERDITNSSPAVNTPTVSTPEPSSRPDYFGASPKENAHKIIRKNSTFSVSQ